MDAHARFDDWTLMQDSSESAKHTHTHTHTLGSSTVKCAQSLKTLQTKTRVHLGQGKLEKSGKIRKCFSVTRKSGNIDYSPIVGESRGI